GKTVCIGCRCLDVFYRGKRDERNDKTQRQRNRQVNAVENKLFSVLKKREVGEVKRSCCQGGFPDIDEVTFHHFWFLIIFISSSSSSGERPFSFTKNATAL